jgi:hypothetical protein
VPWTVRVDAEQRVSYTRISGVVTYDVVTASQQALRREPLFDPTFPFLLDLRSASDVQLTVQQVHAIIEASPVGDQTRRAILVSGLGAFSVAETWMAMRESKTAAGYARAVATLEEAAAWLGVDRLEP